MGVSSAAAHGDAQSRHRDYGCILRRLPEGRQSLQMCRRAGGGGERVETGCSVLDLPLVSQLCI